MIEVKDLVKQYGSHTAVKGISFTVEPGKIYGLLGPNGAGKSTTMNIVTGCLAATSGSVTVNGHDIFEDPKAAKRCIGYLPENPPLYGDMTPLEYLTFVGEAKKMRGNELYTQLREVMEITSLTDVSDRLIRNLSKGYRQRVGIAQAMIGSPDIIILDEPTVGLDPKQILEIRELIKRLGESKTVILSSHILAEISAVCDRVMIISHGSLVANDTLENLEKTANRCDRLHLTIRGDEKDICDVLSGIDGILNTEYSLGSAENEFDFELELAKGADVRENIFFAMAEKKYPVVSMQYEHMTLEDIFLALTDDELLPDENGKMPSVEDILSGKAKKKYGDTEEMLSEEDGSEPEDDANTDETDGTGKPEDEKEENSDDEYKPLFGGKD
ncbi:MAG: ABC transporter ATP-binding protein [Eubacteriales bacterium]